MQIHLSPHLMLNIKYVYSRNNTYYWQRKIPTDLVERYPSSAPLKVNLQTQDPRVIATKVARLNREHEALWAAMRKDPDLTPVAARDAAKDILKAHGLGANGRGADEVSLESFFSTLDQKREAYAESQIDPEEAYRFADPSTYLTKPELEAVRLLDGGSQLLLSDALEVYLEEHHKRGKPGFAALEDDTRRTWGKLTTLLGDKVFAEVTREDAKAFRESLLATLKTTSVARTINSVKAVFGKTIVEKSLNIPNVWNSLKVAGLGEDADTRESFTAAELTKLRALCRESDDDMRWLLAIQLDTGARIAEVVGLAPSDIHIEGEAVPYVEIRPHPWRTLKNTNSKRRVPLVGDALWGARRALEAASSGQQGLFARYVKDGECKSDSASSALNKWMRSNGLEKTTHELRHTMRDRLRVVTPRDIQDAVGGWGQSSIADNYGEGYALRMMQEALLKTIEPNGA